MHFNFSKENFPKKIFGSLRPPKFLKKLIKFQGAVQEFQGHQDQRLRDKLVEQRWASGPHPGMHYA